MTAAWVQIGLVVVLVLLNAALASAETAFMSLRESQLNDMEQRSATGALIARLARDPNRLLVTIRLGIMLTALLAAASAAGSLAGPLANRLTFAGRAAQPVAVTAVTLVLAYVLLVFGTLAPKRVGKQRAERWSLLAARPLIGLERLTRPAVWLLSHSTNLAVRLMGGDPDADPQKVTAEELRDLVAAQSSFTPQQRYIIDGAFQIADRNLSDVLVPRPDVLILDAEATCAEMRNMLVRSGHSRAPVVTSGSLDDVVGIVHLRDLLSDDPDCRAGDVATPAAVFPESLSALDALRQMQRRRIQMAIVVSEHGGAEGIVTIEDLVEELVGEIYDETDRVELAVAREPDGSLVLPGRYPAHDLADLDIAIPDGQYATVAGYLLWRLQRIPDVPGDTVEVEGWRFTVTKLDDLAITEVRATPLPSPAAPGEEVGVNPSATPGPGLNGNAASPASAQ